jgi:hypothetical protein
MILEQKKLIQKIGFLELDMKYPIDLQSSGHKYGFLGDRNEK